MSSEKVVDNYAIGIDLGTCLSVVGHYSKGSVDIYANDQGNRTCPSWVGFTDEERLVGEAAKNISAQFPTSCIYDAKRLIGRTFLDPFVQKAIKHWSFKVVPDKKDAAGNATKEAKPKIEVMVKGEVKQFYPEEISAMVLTKMKETAEINLGHPVKNVVVTVPAYFNDSQRQSTKDACAIAKLNCLRIINEPTAAAMAYGFDKNSEKEKNILIFDYGGGTFDVSVLTMADGVYHIKGVSGDTFCGGQDLDNTLVTYCAKEFFKKNKKDISFDAKATRRLSVACERAKKALSSAAQTTVEVDSLFEGIDFSMVLTRARFEDLCKSEFDKLFPPVDEALKNAKMSKNQIDEVVLVGGSTRIPKVQELLSKYFNGKTLNKSINPDEAVAYGASIQAALLAGVKDDKINDILLVDITALDLGVSTLGDIMGVIVERGSTLPCKKTQTFSNAGDNQRECEILIMEGNRKIASQNNRLGDFKIELPAGMRRGQAKIEITYNMNTDSLLTVTANETSTGTKKTLTVKSNKNNLTKEQLNEMAKEAEKFKEEDEKVAKKVEAKNKFEMFLYEIKNKCNEETFKKNLGEEKLKTLIEAATTAMKWLDELETSATAEDIEKKLKETIEICSPLMVAAQNAQNQQNDSADNGATDGQTKKDSDDEPPVVEQKKASTGPSVSEVD